MCLLWQKRNNMLSRKGHAADCSLMHIYACRNFDPAWTVAPAGYVNCLDVQVIGLACFKALSADGVSFAIPIDTAKDVVQQLQQRGRVVRPYIGIKMLQLNEHNASQMREKDAGFPAVSQGILIPYVAAGSPAAKCGMTDGDVITGKHSPFGTPWSLHDSCALWQCGTQTL